MLGKGVTHQARGYPRTSCVGVDMGHGAACRVQGAGALWPGRVRVGQPQALMRGPLLHLSHSSLLRADPTPTLPAYRPSLSSSNRPAPFSVSRIAF